MRRTIAISDIHGCADELDRLLALVEYRPQEDRLLLLGDYVDRGPRSCEVVDRIMRLVREDGAEALRGNHDQRFVDLMRGRGTETDREKFLIHGGVETLLSYAEGAERDAWAALSPADLLETARSKLSLHFEDQLAWLDSLPYYFEDEGHIYVHAGLNPAYPSWKEQPLIDFLWIREAFIDHPTVVADKTVVFGHTKTVGIHETADVWFGDGKIGIDGGCPFGHRLNALVIRDGQPYQVYHVPSGVRWEVAAPH